MSVAFVNLPLSLSLCSNLPCTPDNEHTKQYYLGSFHAENRDNKFRLPHTALCKVTAQGLIQIFHPLCSGQELHAEFKRLLFTLLYKCTVALVCSVATLRTCTTPTYCLLHAAPAHSIEEGTIAVLPCSVFTCVLCHLCFIYGSSRWHRGKSNSDTAKQGSSSLVVASNVENASTILNAPIIGISLTFSV